MDKESELAFLLDENIPYSLMGFLQRRGYNVDHIRKLGMAGIRNGEVYQLAVSLKSWIVTRDKDFRNYEKFLSYDVAGIIVIESELDLTRQQVVEVFERFLKTFESKLASKSLIIINDGEFRLLAEE
ncbi:MAG TPA: DUF5615 family PIN-like protein [Candidatus Kapabacteria bacterium]|nr:DUF5615 family PIN-like protein [Candidatus Kapabacteria bacterium]